MYVCMYVCIHTHDSDFGRDEVCGSVQEEKLRTDRFSRIPQGFRV